MILALPVIGSTAAAGCLSLGAVGAVALGGDRAAFVADEVRPAHGVAALPVLRERYDHPYIACLERGSGGRVVVFSS
jgi:hypothetical protein